MAEPRGTPCLLGDGPGTFSHLDKLRKSKESREQAFNLLVRPGRKPGISMGMVTPGSKSGWPVSALRSNGLSYASQPLAPFLQRLAR